MAAPASSTAGADLASLQSTIGNRAMTNLLRGPVSRMSSGTPLPPPPVAQRKMDDQVATSAFNSHSVVNDLIRAIDQSEPTAKFESGGRWTPVRKVDFEKVYEVLNGLTATQIGVARYEYAQRGTGGKRTLDADLFGSGESGLPSSLTVNQTSRLRVVLRGTDPPATDATDQVFGLSGMNGPRAKELVAGLEKLKLAPARLHQAELDALELVQRLKSDLTGDNLERVMALQRRAKPEITAIDSYYELHTSVKLAGLLATLLEGPQLMRMWHLRSGEWLQADAYALEGLRQALEVIDEVDDSSIVSVASKLSGAGAATAKWVTGGREAVLAKIDEIVARNRSEAITKAEGTLTSPSDASSARVTELLSVRTGQGGSVGDALAQTVGAKKAAEYTALAKGDVVEAYARRLAETESRKATTHAQLVATLQGLRAQAEADIVAGAADPWMADSDKQALLDPTRRGQAVTKLAKAYISQFRWKYGEVRGGGRPWIEIVDALGDADETEMNQLESGGGAMEDHMALDVALQRGKPEEAIAILKRQPHQEAVAEVTEKYRRLTGKDLRKVLFGVTIASGGETAATSYEASREDRNTKIIPGVMKGRNAALAVEQLAKPGKDADEITQVRWLLSSAEREYEATLENKGWTGAAREWGDDPETQILMRESIQRIRDLSTRWAETEDSRARKPIVAEIKKWRATLTGDAKAYEADNAQMRDAIRSAVSIVAQLALAIALPGAGATLLSFVRITALNIATSIATDVIVYGEDYSLDQLKGSIISGVAGAAGGKLADKFVDAAIAARVAARGAGKEAAVATGEVVENVANTIAKPIADETASAATKVGVKTTIAKEAANQVGSNAAVTVATGENQFTVDNLLISNLVSQGAKVGKKVLGIPDGPAAKPSEPDQTTDTGGAGGAGHSAEHDTPGKASPEQPEAPKAGTEQTTETKKRNDLTAVPAVLAGSVVAGSTGAGGGKRPPPGAIDPASAGIPPASQRSIQQLADQRNIIIKARPVNLDAIPHLERGALAKPEIVKSKTLKPIDELIGGPKGKEGLVGFFEPHPPSDTLPADVRKAAQERYQQRKADYEQHLAEYQKLEAEGILRRNNGVLELADPRGSSEGSFKPVSGDLDIFDITHADGSALTALQQMAIVNELRFMGVNVEHGAHEWWRAQNAESFDPKVDADIRAQHLNKDPLVAFVPLTSPQGVWADTPVTGPTRTEGSGDRHQPLANATEGAPGGAGTDGPGTGGPDPGGAGTGGPGTGGPGTAGTGTVGTATPGPGTGGTAGPGTVGTATAAPAPGATTQPRALPGASALGSGMPSGELSRSDFAHVHIRTMPRAGGARQMLILELPDGRQFIFKPAHAEQPHGYRGGAQGQESSIVEGEFYRRNGAAAVIADALGVRTPDVASVTYNGKPGSLQAYAEGTALGAGRTKDQIDAFAASAPMRDLDVFDYVIANQDRNAGNVLIGADGRPTAIDHDLSFPATERRFGQPDVPGTHPSDKEDGRQYRKDGSRIQLEAWQRKLPPAMSAEMADRLRAMVGNEAAFRERLAPYLDAAEIDGALARARLILNLMDTQGFPAVI